MTEEEVRGMIERHGLRRFTPKTITTVTQLKKRLAEVKQLGYAVVDGEYKPDLCAIAVPIRDYVGKIAASLMTAIPSDRSSKNKSLVEGLIDVLKSEAALISKQIGYAE